MTRKDFVLIASVIAGIQDKQQRRSVAEAFAAALATTNSGFNRARFLKTCDV